MCSCYTKSIDGYACALPIVWSWPEPPYSPIASTIRLLLPSTICPYHMRKREGAMCDELTERATPTRTRTRSGLHTIRPPVLSSTPSPALSVFPSFTGASRPDSATTSTTALISMPKSPRDHQRDLQHTLLCAHAHTFKR